MKGQYLFYSFLPGVTAAVLTSQPALASTVNGVQLTSSPSFLTSTDSRTWVADNINTQLPNSQTQIFPDIGLESGLTTVDLQFSSGHSNTVILTGNTAIPIENELSQQDEGKSSSFTHSLNSAQNSAPHDFESHEKQSQVATSKQQLETTVFPNVTSQATSAQPASFSLSALWTSAASPKQPETQLSTVLPTAVTGRGTANLQAAHSCSQENGTNGILISGFSATSTCQPENLAGNLIAQSYPSTPNTTSALENTGWELTPSQAETENFPPANTGENLMQTETENFPPANTGENLMQPETVEFAPTGAAEIPDNLNPNANPLQFPTKPEEVRIENNQPITLAQALELAKRNNRDLQVSLLELERAQAALRQAQAALLPNVGLNADITRSRAAAQQLQLDQQARQLNQPAPQAEANTAFRGEAQLTYDLFTNGRRQANIRQAEEQVRLNELAVERQSEEIRLSVSTDYYNLQQADERVRIAQSAVENAQASLRDAQSLERAGVGTRFDVLQSQVNLANSQQELTNNVSQQQIARRLLSTRLSVPQSVNLSAADPVQLAGLWKQDLESSIVLAIQNRPELQQQLAQRNISEQQRRAALSALGPQVSLIASYNLLDQFDDSVSVTDGYSVGVRASLNLYDGGAAKASAAQAKANVAIAETRFSEQRNQIRFQVEEAFSTQRANLENVQTANTALEQAREALRLARLRFQAGVGTQTDVINSENDLTRAEGNRITAILDYNRALAQLQRAVTTRALGE
ncbi:TolC family protein [Nodularia spumigena]|uniref:TolC family protein n=1 Tax=Nodularia spumigena UHCC 0060 TaxID=3110300 RepID=A0ABU5UR66_NODSP|nr:TolC family protein [Nodularia spumigena]MEA5525197.1 TolC family protein [Nodularia spumigena UHCC 0143]MEA5555086.1 TolC family protein [Nodularia spumigena CH309]MEA5607570.1 TolC family protein [Nodularia spumigena UHCC 0060]MEA5611665.1 TolC family protein [Nodularia spumigena UHCC 0040]